MADPEAGGTPNFLKPDGTETGVEVGQQITVEAKAAIADVYGLGGRARHHVLRPGKLDGEDRTITITGRFDGLVDYDTKLIDYGYVAGMGGILANCVKVTESDKDGDETAFRIVKHWLVAPPPPAEEAEAA